MSSALQNKSTKKRPNKKGKKKDAGENAPIFLRKTYHMIDTCDPDIAAWSDDGLTFVVKDADRFASEIIGQFFKHNNLSSFVRQLNFYGFRKVKSDPLRIRDAATDVESRYWKFRHDKFQRGRPDLLSEIRKSNHTEAAEKQEVDALKSEIKELKSRLASMSSDMDKLASLVGTVMKSTGTQHALQDASPNKKRKILPHPAESLSMNETPEPLPVTSLPDASTARDSDLLYDDSAEAKLAPAMHSAIPAKSKFTSRDESVASLTSVDEEILTSLFALEPSDDDHELMDMTSPAMPSIPEKYDTDLMDMGTSNIPDIAVSLPPAQHPPQMCHSEPDPVLVEKMRNALSQLPKSLQELFVERLVVAITSPESFQHQVDAVSALASAAAKEAEKRLQDSFITGDDLAISETKEKQSVELATAVLGSFLSRYSAAAKNKQLGGRRASVVPLEL